MRPGTGRCSFAGLVASSGGQRAGENLDCPAAGGPDRLWASFWAPPTCIPHGHRLPSLPMQLCSKYPAWGLCPISIAKWSTPNGLRRGNRVAFEHPQDVAVPQAPSGRYPLIGQNVRNALIVLAWFISVAFPHQRPGMGDPFSGKPKTSGKKSSGLILGMGGSWETFCAASQIAHFHWHEACRYNVAKRGESSVPQFVLAAQTKGSDVKKWCCGCGTLISRYSGTFSCEVKSEGWFHQPRHSKVGVVFRRGCERQPRVAMSAPV